MGSHEAMLYPSCPDVDNRMPGLCGHSACMKLQVKAGITRRPPPPRRVRNTWTVPGGRPAQPRRPGEAPENAVRAVVIYWNPDPRNPAG